MKLFPNLNLRLNSDRLLTYPKRQR